MARINRLICGFWHPEAFRPTGRQWTGDPWYPGAVNDREKDKARLDRLLDAWDRELQADPDIETLVLASRSLPALLERRSKLLGLDATPDDKDRSSAAESPVKRILAAVPKGGGA